MILSNVLLCAEYLSAFLVIFHPELRKRSKKNLAGIMVCLFLWGTVEYLDMQGFKISLKGLWIENIFIVVIFYFLFQVTIVEMIVWGIAEWLILSIFEITIFISIQQILELSTENMKFNENIVSLILIVAFGIAFLIIRKRYMLRALNIPIRTWIVLDVILFILTIMITFFLYSVLFSIPATQKAFLIERIVFVIGGSALLISIFIMLYIYNSNYKNLREKEMAELQSHLQKEYFMRLLSREEETRKFRHNIIHDLHMIKKHCQSKEYGLLEDYIDSAFGEISATNRMIYESGNDIIDMMLNYYFIPLSEKAEVKISGKITQEIKVSERELCIIMANVFNNVSEAIKKVERGKITVRFSSGQNFFGLKIQNNYAGKIDMGKDGLPKTSKSDKNNHGFGTKSIKEIVEKNGGEYEISIQDGLFSTEIYLKNEPFTTL